METRKRKVKVNYDEDDDEAEESPPQPKSKRGKSVKSAPAKRNTPAKRSTAPRAAKVNRKDPDWLVTNAKSPLAYEDLHAELSDPKTYEGYTKEDWDDLRETLPPDIPLNPDGYSISIEFLKYNPDFRRGIREFQEDLASGRLEPEWQAAAAQAMEERARGDFDKYKEDQFEAFWGQKQKLDRTVLAGEVTNLKLEVLVENGLFREGDVFCYARVINKPNEKILIEKECKLVKIQGVTLTFAIPPGRLKFARLTDQEALPATDATIEDQAMTTSDVIKVKATENKFSKNVAPVKEMSDIAASPSKDGTETALEQMETGDDVDLINESIETSPTSPKDDEAEAVPENIEPEEGPIPSKSRTKKGKSKTPTKKKGTKAPTAVKKPPTTPSDAVTDYMGEAVILHDITNLNQLNHKIIDIDGRMSSKDAPAVNSWKILRAKRNNQDMGTLFEMREEYYVWKNPKIVKTPRKKRE